MNLPFTARLQFYSLHTWLSCWDDSLLLQPQNFVSSTWIPRIKKTWIERGSQLYIKGYVADSPAELACYHATYVQFMESYLPIVDQGNLTTSPQHAAHVRKSRKHAADLTRGSLITTTLHLATKAPSVMKRSMVLLFDQIEELTAPQWLEESSTIDCELEEDIEEAGEKDADTEQSEVDDSDIVRKDSCTDSTESEEQVTSNKHISIDELMDEIEKLTNISSVSSSDRDVTLGSADVEESPSAERIAADLRVEH